MNLSPSVWCGSIIFSFFFSPHIEQTLIGDFSFFTSLFDTPCTPVNIVFSKQILPCYAAKSIPILKKRCAVPVHIVKQMNCNILISSAGFYYKQNTDFCIVADPGCLSRIPDPGPGSRIPDPDPDPTIFCGHKYHKILNKIIFEQEKRTFFRQNTKNDSMCFLPKMFLLG
jgi:hypothetical protein